MQSCIRYWIALRLDRGWILIPVLTVIDLPHTSRPEDASQVVDFSHSRPAHVVSAEERLPGG